MMSNRQAEIQRRIFLKKYMKEIVALSKACREISEEDISSVEFLQILKNLAGRKTIGSAEQKFVIDFEERRSKRFSDFIQELHALNGSSVYFLTDSGNSSGVFKFDSILSVNFDFPYTAVAGEVIVFLTESKNDKMLLDIDSSDTGSIQLHIELTGDAWPMASTYK